MNNMPLHHNQFDIRSSKHYLTLLIVVSTTVIIIAVIMYLVLNLAPLDLLYMIQGATKEIIWLLLNVFSIDMSS